MTPADDDVFALAGIAQTATPSHWTPIVRTQDFDAQQKATRARLAETYEPGRSEWSMMAAADPRDVNTVTGWLPFSMNLVVDASALLKAYEKLIDDLLRSDVYKDDFEPWHMTWTGVKTAAPKPRKPNFDEMTPRARALALKNDRARTKGIEGTKKAIRKTQEPK